jgi:hypothetical protein
VSGFIRVRDLAREGGPDRAVRRSAERGDLSRIARGRYLSTSDWDALDRDLQYRARIHAFVETTRTPQVFSHWSAAALWGYPIIGAWPNRIHLTFNPGTAHKSTPRVMRHITRLSDEEVVELDGLFITSPLRTLVDLARCASFPTGVAACDYALAEPKDPADTARHVERAALLERADELQGQRGVARLRSVGEFADGRSGSPGESLSRVQIARLRFPPPDLQVEVLDLDGNLWHTDFGWQEQRLLGEFDGMVKYTRGRFLGDRDLAEVVIEEKLREDAIRAASGCGLVRWTWPTASDPAKLQRLLLGAGLRPE